MGFHFGTVSLPLRQGERARLAGQGRENETDNLLPKGRSTLLRKGSYAQGQVGWFVQRLWLEEELAINRNQWLRDGSALTAGGLEF